jgi:hypothetical protein
VEFSRVATVPEIAELRHSGAGEGIFLQSFVLRHFSIVQEGQASQQQLAAPDSWGSNLSWTSECNEARTSWSILSEAFSFACPLSGWMILLQKSFRDDERNFSGPLMRSARGDVRDHIVLHKNDHGRSYRAWQALQR